MVKNKLKPTTVDAVKRAPWTNMRSYKNNWDFPEDDDDYHTQPAELFNLMDKKQKKTLVENSVRAMGNAPKEKKLRHIRNCIKADAAYWKGVAEALGTPLKEAS